MVMTPHPDDDPSEPAFVYRAVIPHPTRPRILLLPRENGWVLPHWEISWLPNRQDISHVNQSVMDGLHLDVRVLRCLSYEANSERDRARAVYVTENRGADEAPPAGGCWVGSDRLEEIPLACPEDRALMGDCLAEIADANVPRLRRPWARSGWFDAAESWIREQFRQLGITPDGPIEQLRTWARSCLLRAPTGAGLLYFKAVPSTGAPEPWLLRLLSERYPRHFPRILAVDTDRNWLLMGDLGSQTFCQIPEVERWEEALKGYAQLQIDLAGSVADLLAMGCPDQRLSALEPHIDRLLADPDAALVGKPGGLTPDEMEALRALAPRLRATCAVLAAFGVPETLEHGDLWAGNIVMSGGSHVYFDWAESSVAHPSFSFLLFMPDATSRLSHVPDARRRLRDAYLGPWTVYAPMEQLIEAFELALPLAALHHALLQHRVVLPNLEAGSWWELHGEIPWDLKYILRHREKLQPSG
jgi:hypothetical protein